MRNGESTPEDIRRHALEWIEENRDQVDQWLKTARAAAG
jgi:glycine betaine/proline transport system substrate-binding protein